MNLDREAILDRIDPNKDVDGLNIVNQGKLFNARPAIEPATAKGIITLLKPLLMLASFSVEKMGETIEIRPVSIIPDPFHVHSHMC